MVSTLQSWSEPIILPSQTLKAIPVLKINKHMYQDMILSCQDDEYLFQGYNKVLEETADADVTLEDDVLWYKGRLCVPVSVDPKKMILHTQHDPNVAGHMGHERTIELVQRILFWPKMGECIEDYISMCPDCQMIQAAQHAHDRLLQPPELAYRPWGELSMHCSLDLPVSVGCWSQWVVVDRLTKMSHFSPLREGEKKAPDFIPIFLREMWRYHGIPSTITSDRATRLTSTNSKGIVATLRIRSRMSSPFLLQTDGQTQRVNQSLECYLRKYCNSEQDNWEGMWSMAEYAYNNSLRSTVKIMPFLAKYGYYPWTTRPAGEPSQNPNFSKLQSVDGKCSSTLSTATWKDQWNNEEIPQYECQTCTTSGKTLSVTCHLP